MGNEHNREQIPKKIRFDVFKRDSFTCQYCGMSAPDVVLEVDHIKSVAEGGNNDIFNLITSCRDCNRGKGKVRLTDRQEIKKQKRELDALNDRREQMEMMLEWKNELAKLEDKEIDEIEKVIKTISKGYLTQYGRKIISGVIKQFGFVEAYEATEIAVAEYDADTAIGKIGGICYNRRIKRVKEKDGNLQAGVYVVLDRP